MYNCILKYIPLKNLSKLQFGDNLPSSKKKHETFRETWSCFLEFWWVLVTLELNWWIPFPKNKKTSKAPEHRPENQTALVFFKFFLLLVSGSIFLFFKRWELKRRWLIARTTNLTRCRCTRWCWGAHVFLVRVNWVEHFWGGGKATWKDAPICSM